MSKAKEILLEILGGIALATILIIFIIIVLATETDYNYAVAIEDEFGVHYEYVTERICTVTEIKNDLITVDCKGKLYQFYGTGYTINDEIICVFNEANEIIDTKFSN